MNNGKICISICESTVQNLLSKINRANSISDIVEIRLDCLNTFELDAIRAEPSAAAQTMGETLQQITAIESALPRIITFRPSSQGGCREIPFEERFDLWNGGVEGHIADVEEDLIEGTFAWLWNDRICSFHDFSGAVVDVRKTFERLFRTGAGIIKIAVAVNETFDAIPLWQLFRLAKLNNVGLIPIAMGEAGKWTRILGLAHGAYLTYAALDTGGETAPGQITAREMIDVFRVKELDKSTEVYGIIAGDTTYTMSPYIHNAAFKATGSNAVFVPLQVKDLDTFMRRMVLPETREIDLNFRGFSVTNPHKQAIVQYLDHVDTAAAKIGAVNTVKIEDGKLVGFNTDAQGFIAPLADNFGDLRRARAAVIGAGGAARACIYSLKDAGADVTIFARNSEKAEALAEEFGVDSKPLTTDFSDFDIVVNATPLGTRGKGENETIATAEQLRGVKLVYDLVYNPTETRLLREAKLAGAQTLGGFKMLMAQAAEQFKIWTEKPAPIEEMTAAAQKRLNES